uniref:Muscular LMNA interacting protein n=1 Tax=Serinus canaria TaxID=9135 RepID=A0A8C9NB02_SERCA
MTYINKSVEEVVSSQESGTKPLTFTFIPSIGQLPTHFEVVDISKFLVTIPEEPKDLSNQNIVNKVDFCSTRTAFPPLGCHSSKGEMQENDLFKAEFILITDSGDEDEVAAASSNVHQPSNGYSPISAQLLTTSHVSPGTEAGKPPGDGHLPGVALSHGPTDPQKHQYKIKTSYKAFAAIPTNTLLMEQKVSVCSKTWALHCTFETIQLCVQILTCLLGDTAECECWELTTQDCNSSHFTDQPFSLKINAAGRETRYVSTFAIALCFTKPGVIRPVLVKGKSAQQKEEPYQPNPFKKYLEEISDQNIEQVKDCLLHPQYPTKLISPTKSPLCPPSMSLTDCPNPGLSATSLPLCVMFMRILIALTDTTLCTIR